METIFNGNQVRVMVAYDNFISGCRAMSVLKRIRGPVSLPGHLAHVMVRFDMMADDSFFELAVNAALAADMVVIATVEGQELPRKVQEWMVQWLLRKEDCPQALVAILNGQLSSGSRPGGILAYLEKLAGYGNMPFFSHATSRAPELQQGIGTGNDWAFDSALVRPSAAQQN